MKYTFEDDLENNLMHVKVKIKSRNLMCDKLELVKWKDISRLVEDEYQPPATHELKECINPVQNLNNRHPDRCSGTWTFILNKKHKDSSVKSKRLKTTRRKKTVDR